MKHARSIALIAHDHCKKDLLDWVKTHRTDLEGHDLVATGTTGRLIRNETGLEVRALESGPLGGDLEVGALIAKGEIDMLFFFWDPLQSQPHDPDIKALLRVAVVWNIPVACNRATADYLVKSPHFQGGYKPVRPDFSDYRGRSL